MNKKPKMTIEDLAILMEKRFAQQDKRIDTRFALMLTKEDGANLEARFDEKIDSFAGMVLRCFEAQDKKIEGLITELREFKEETNENFGKIRTDILNLDDRFVTHKQAEHLQLKIKTT